MLAQIDAIILAGGQGTRLSAALPGRQKVAASVAGKPFFCHLLDRLDESGIRRITLATGHLAADVESVLPTYTDSRTQIAISTEDRPLGTGGATRCAALSTRSDPVLVLNGDSIAEIDFAALLAVHRAREAAATIALVRAPEPGRFGAVQSTADGTVTAFDEKPEGMAEWINAGVYLFTRRALAAIPGGRPVSLEREILPALVGHGLFAEKFDARFIDIGTPASLAAADAFFAGGRA
jgi:mannose-1-phosphate guanylyltransferase